jgi:glycine hydroxymethyltransferase
MAHFAGLVAAGLLPNPVEHCDFVTSTTHKTLAGPRAGFILCREEHAKAIDSAVMPGMQGGPLEHTIAAKATCFRIAMTDAFREYQTQIRGNADALAETLIDGGLSLVTGGTDTHLLLVDLRESEWTGKAAEERLHEISVTVNRNTVPFDERSPFVTSGIRLGSPAMTMRGFDEDDFREVGRIICEALTESPDLDGLRARVAALCAKRPLYDGFRGYTTYVARAKRASPWSSIRSSSTSSATYATRTRLPSTSASSRTRSRSSSRTRPRRPCPPSRRRSRHRSSG